MNLKGKAGSCARLRVITTKSAGLGVDKQSQRFPENSSSNYGYYTYCQADGKGSKTYSGTDQLHNTATTFYGDLKSAQVTICYTKSADVPPGGDCNDFRVNWGD